MEKLLFAEVQTFKSVNNLGFEFGKYVSDNYHRKVISENRMKAVIGDIKYMKVKFEEQHPRCRKMIVIVNEFQDKLGRTFYAVSSKPENDHTDNYAFILRTTIVEGFVGVNYVELG